MHYKKLISRGTIIEFHNSWSGVETIIVNGRQVSQKSSVWGISHYFTVVEQDRRVRYILTTKVNSNMQVFVDLRRNGQLIHNDVRVNKGVPNRSGKKTPYRKPDNKAKKIGLSKLKDYQLEEALVEFKKAQKVDSQDPEIYFHLACIYSILEKTQEGFEALKKATEYGFTDKQSILNHDMLAFLRLNEAFEDFLESGFTKYDKALFEKKSTKNTTTTAHSEYGLLKSIFIKKVADAFVDEYTINNNWQDLNYLEKPDLTTAIAEYKDFIQLLENQQTTIRFFLQNYSVGMDSMYCRDASIATDAGMILCNMGKAQRKSEPEAAQKAFEEAGIKILGTIKAPGIIEGGDVAWLDEKTLAIAHGYRTNQEGFAQMKALLEPIGVELLQVDLPHYKGPSDVFHLMSIFSPVDKGLAVVYSPLMPVSFRNELLERGYKLVEVPDEEFISMGCNVLAIAPRKCVMVKGNPITKSRLEQAGCTVFEYNGNEISIKGGGGPTCLTRPILRYKG